MGGFAKCDPNDALGLAELVRKKEVTPEELLEAAIERVEARNPAINAVTMKRYAYGRKAIADGLPDGAFRDVPFLRPRNSRSLAPGSAASQRWRPGPEP